jgi:hypothetical protein
VSGNLLVVDWDSFFPELTQDPKMWGLYDWGHAETWLYKGPIWSSRAVGFLMNDLPLPGMNEDWKTFWDRFDIDAGVLHYADSNVYAMADELWFPGEPPDQVWLYDAHHDSGYGDRADKKPGVVSCEDWMVAYGEAGSELHMRYPTWKTWAMELEPEPWVEVDRAFDDGQPNPVKFDSVFVCRSGAWTPPWCDLDFERFLYSAPVDEIYELDECEPRAWDTDAVQRELATTRELLRRTHA